MPISFTRLAAVLLPLILAACSSAPAPAKPDEPQRVSLLCHEGARAALFDKMGVPAGERPDQVALGPEHVWVRFESGRLLRLTLAGAKVDVEMRLPEPGERWTAMDVDPADGSIWLASDQLRLVRITPAGVSSRIPLQGITGTSDFRDLRVKGDTVWAVPICAGYRLLRFDRTGRLRGTALPIEPRPPGAVEDIQEVSRLGCGGVLLERDAAGRLLAFNPVEHLTYELDAQGEWVASASPLFAGFPDYERSVVQGVDVGGASPSSSQAGSGSPCRRPRSRIVDRRALPSRWRWRSISGSVGSITSAGLYSRGRLSRVFMVPTAGGGTRALVESCYGNLLLDVATDGRRYAAITERTVVFGDVASAPDLP
jgi:hypothetical protein